MSTTREILSTDAIQRAVERLAEAIDNDYEEVALVGILSGAAYFLVDLSRTLTISHTVHFVQASSYHDIHQGETVAVNGLTEKDVALIRGRKILVVDELYDNGKTLNSIVTYLVETLKIDPSNIATCVAFRKDKQVKYPLPTYCGIDNLPDVWFVGYGLDDNGTKRNLRNLIGVPKPPGVPKSKDEAIFTDEKMYNSIVQLFNRIE